MVFSLVLLFDKTVLVSDELSVDIILLGIEVSLEELLASFVLNANTIMPNISTSNKKAAIR